MKTIDLNCDMGELQPHQTTNFDAEIMPFISSCNIACGFHSGHPTLIEKTIKTAIRHQVKIGAHPSYNDPKNFGRLSIKVPLETLMAELRYQICAIKGIVESFGQRLHHVKPHGALYNDMAVNTDLATAFINLIKSIDPNLKLFALAHSSMIDICTTHQIKVVREGFADRRYQAINQLRSRSLKNAVIHDSKQVLAQVEGFLNGKVELWDTTVCPIQIDSICLHSDTKGAVDLSQIIYHHLMKKNVQIAANL